MVGAYLGANGLNFLSRLLLRVLWKFRLFDLYAFYVALFLTLTQPPWRGQFTYLTYKLLRGKIRIRYRVFWFGEG
ncbi:MAG: hypothetical protein DRO36_01425 [Candidatus Hecatellales archaeon]|nr:MAG: hypothetical protein DRO36_01425 [Candidatus Hecatellales archaeon]